MLALLSPAKKMNFEVPDTNFSGGEPRFRKEAYQLAKQLNKEIFATIYYASCYKSMEISKTGWKNETRLLNYTSFPL